MCSKTCSTMRDMIAHVTVVACPNVDVQNTKIRITLLTFETEVDFTVCCSPVTQTLSFGISSVQVESQLRQTKSDAIQTQPHIDAQSNLERSFHCFTVIKPGFRFMNNY